MNWYIESQVTSFESQATENIGSPNISIYPLEPKVQEVVRELQSESPGFFDHISNIVVDLGYGQFGSVESTSANTIRINMNKIKDELRQKGWAEGAPEYDEQLKRVVKQVIIHEHAHSTTWNKQTGEFEGGEFPAERAVQQYFGY